LIRRSRQNLDLESLLGLTVPIVPDEPPELRSQLEGQAPRASWLTPKDTHASLREHVAADPPASPPADAEALLDAQEPLQEPVQDAAPLAMAESAEVGAASGESTLVEGPAPPSTEDREPGVPGSAVTTPEDSSTDRVGYPSGTTRFAVT
jgi:hypothetical protein